MILLSDVRWWAAWRFLNQPRLSRLPSLHDMHDMNWYDMIKQHSWRSETYLFHPDAILDTLTSTRAGGFFESWSETSQLHELLCNLRATAAANSTAQWYAATHGSPGWPLGRFIRMGLLPSWRHLQWITKLDILTTYYIVRTRKVGCLSGSRAASA